MIISISGTPKTGKTSVAEALAKKLGWRLVSLNQLAQEKRLYLGYDKARRSRIVDLKKLSAEVRRLSKSQKNLILESHYSHDMPCDVVVILRTNPKELRKRMSRKGWPRRKIEENVEAEIMEVVKSEALESAKRVLEMDTTGRKPEWVAGQIAARLRLKNRLETK
jgi:adenylate kinase